MVRTIKQPEHMFTVYRSQPADQIKLIQLLTVYRCCVADLNAVTGSAGYFGDIEATIAGRSIPVGRITESGMSNEKKVHEIDLSFASNSYLDANLN